MTGEHDVLVGILARLDALALALDEDVDALDGLPAHLHEFQAMDRARRVASRALFHVPSACSFTPCHVLFACVARLAACRSRVLRFIRARY